MFHGSYVVHLHQCYYTELFLCNYCLLTNAAISTAVCVVWKCKHRSMTQPGTDGHLINHTSIHSLTPDTPCREGRSCERSTVVSGKHGSKISDLIKQKTRVTIWNFFKNVYTAQKLLQINEKYSMKLALPLVF